MLWQVVASAADGQLPFDTCANVILDAFKILGSRAIRIGRRAQQDDQNEAQVYPPHTLDAL